MSVSFPECDNAVVLMFGAAAEFMIGLEKSKMKAGDVSHSVRAVSEELMQQLYNCCMDKRQKPATLR